MTEFEEYMGIRSAAEHLGVTRGMCYRYCKTGALSPVVSPIGFLVRRADVCALRARKRG